MIELEKEIFDDYLFSSRGIDSPTDMLIGTGDTNTDRHIETDLMVKEDVTLKMSIREKFITDRKLRYAFHQTFIKANSSLFWILKTKIYFFNSKENLIEFIRINEKETFDKMKIDSPEKEDFIFTNTY